MVTVDGVVFENETDAFNAHDLEALGRLLAEDVVFCAPGGIKGEGRPACVEFYRRWLKEFPMRTWRLTRRRSSMTSLMSKARS